MFNQHLKCYIAIDFLTANLYQNLRMALVAHQQLQSFLHDIVQFDFLGDDLLHIERPFRNNEITSGKMWRYASVAVNSPL